MPTNTSVSRMLVSHGSVVQALSSAVTPISVHGRPSNLSARSVSASTQTVSADCAITTGQKSGWARIRRNSA